MEIDSKYFPIINALIKPISLINALSTPKKKKERNVDPDPYEINVKDKSLQQDPTIDLSRKLSIMFLSY